MEALAVQSLSSSSHGSEYQELIPHHHEPGTHEVKSLGLRHEYLIDTEQEWGPKRCVQLALSGRSHCKHCDSHIDDGEIRFGVKVLIQEHTSWTWYHPRCVTPRQIKNIAKLGYKQVEDLFGYDTLPEDKRSEIHTLWAKVEEQIKQSDPKTEDFTGMEEMKEEEMKEEEMKEEEMQEEEMQEEEMQEEEMQEEEMQEGEKNVPLRVKFFKPTKAAKRTPATIKVESVHHQPLRKKVARKVVVVKASSARSASRASSARSSTLPLPKIKQVRVKIDTKPEDQQRNLTASRSCRKRKLPMRYEM